MGGEGYRERRHGEEERGDRRDGQAARRRRLRVDSAEEEGPIDRQEEAHGNRRRDSRDHNVLDAYAEYRAEEDAVHSLRVARVKREEKETEAEGEGHEDGDDDIALAGPLADDAYADGGG